MVNIQCDNFNKENYGGVPFKLRPVMNEGAPDLNLYSD